MPTTQLKAVKSRSKIVVRYNDKGKPVCSKMYADGSWCESPVLMPNGRCVLHGGKTPRGIASPHFVHGHRIANLPERLLATTQAHLNSPDKLSLEYETAVWKSRTDELIARADTGESGELWRSLQSTYREAQKQRRLMNSLPSGDKRDKAKWDFEEAFDALSICIAEGLSDYTAWEEASKAAEQVRRLSETDAKRIKMANDTLTARDTMDLGAAIYGMVTRNVTSPTERAACAADLIRIFNKPDSAGDTGLTNT